MRARGDNVIMMMKYGLKHFPAAAAEKAEAEKLEHFRCLSGNKWRNMLNQMYVTHFHPARGCLAYLEQHITYVSPESHLP